MIANQTKVYNRSNIEQLKWPDNEQASYAKRYLFPLIIQGSSCYAVNASCEVQALSFDDIVIPVTVCQGNLTDTYTCSIYTHYISYAIEELWELNNKPLQILASLALRTLGLLLKNLNINNCVMINNWLVSTNLYTPYTREQLDTTTELLTGLFPGHAIVYRSLNDTLSGDFTRNLVETDYKRIMSRQVYILKSENIRGRSARINRQDRALLDSSGYKILKNTDISGTDAVRILALYNLLYIDKYSASNPAFTVEFIQRAIKDNLLEIRVLYGDNGIDGVLGFFVRNGAMTAPLFGYDTSLPRKIGLYRMLSVLLLDEAIERELVLHQSSGAAEFKRCRGAKADIEYNAVYSKHLGMRQRLGWRLIEVFANKIALPLIRHYKL